VVRILCERARDLFHGRTETARLVLDELVLLFWKQARMVAAQRDELHRGRIHPHSVRALAWNLEDEAIPLVLALLVVRGQRFHGTRGVGASYDELLKRRRFKVLALGRLPHWSRGCCTFEDDVAVQI